MRNKNMYHQKRRKTETIQKNDTTEIEVDGQ